MKVKKKRIISLFFAMLMLFSVLPAGTMTASAATLTLAQLKAKFPQDKYWNGGNADSYTSKACTCHGKNICINGISPCTCNHFLGGTQCFGFSLKLGYDAYGSNPRNWGRAYNLNNIKPGDIINYLGDGHTVFVTGVSGDIVSFAECNWSARCIIKWNRSLKKSEFTNLKNVYVAPSALTGGSTAHTHSYSGSYFEAAHPHKIYQKCSCGATKYTGATRGYQSCSTCMHLSWSYVQPVKAYTINTGKTTVYNAVNGTAKSNKIYDTDLCTISQIYDCGWCKVTFPLDAGGTDTGYCKISVFMKGGGYYLYTSKQINTYRRSDLKTSNGYAGAGDKIYILGVSGSAVQIAYPLTAGGWKVGWIPTSAIKCTVSYNANGGVGSMPNSSVQYNSKFTLTANKFTKTGYTFSGWNVYRSSDKKWYVAGEGWKTASEISSKGYNKKLYTDKWSGSLSQAWTLYGKTNNTFTFYAVWTPNKLSVNYNANGGTISSDTYNLSNNIVYKKSDKTKLTQTWTYNAAQKNGLYNASTFGLTRDGYTFKGWGTTASGGSVFDQNDAALVPSKINANIKNGSCATTLYAIWGKKENPVTHTHEWNTDYTIDKEPTCTETGLKSIYCKSCGETKNSVAIPMAEHQYSDVISKAATCAQEGLREKVCSECGLHTAQETIPMLEHEFGEWEIVSEATAEIDGIETRKCEKCDYAETKNVEYIPVYDETAPRISMTSTNAKLGDEIEMKVNIENNPGITALRLVIGYDEEALEMTGFSFGDALSSMNKGTSEYYGSDYSFSMYSATADLTDCGTIAIIKFKIKDDAENGEYSITISYDSDDIFNFDGDCVDFDIETGAVMVNSCLLGDVNDDSKINMRDVVLLQQVVNGWNVNYNSNAADYNGDGKTNMRDIVALQQYING